jgi:hypothetical protein
LHQIHKFVDEISKGFDALLALNNGSADGAIPAPSFNAVAA